MDEFDLIDGDDLDNLIGRIVDTIKESEVSKKIMDKVNELEGKIVALDSVNEDLHKTNGELMRTFNKQIEELTKENEELKKACDILRDDNANLGHELGKSKEPSKECVSRIQKALDFFHFGGK